MPSSVDAACCGGGEENRRRFLPRTPPTPRTAAAGSDRLDLFVGAPYATLRVYRKALPSGRASPVSAWSSKLAPRRPTRPQAYGSDCVRESRYWVAAFSSSMGKVVPHPVQADRSRPRKGTRSKLAWKSVPFRRPPLATQSPRHGAAVDQAAQSRIRQDPRPRASVRGVSGVRGRRTKTLPSQPPLGYSSRPRPSGRERQTG